MDFGDIPFYIHIGALFLAGAGMLYADKAAMQWLLSKRETLDPRPLAISHRMVGAALAVLIVTGFYMFWPMRDYLLAQPLFWAKMAFVAALIANAFVIGRLMHTSTRTPFNALSFGQKLPLFLSGGISVMCWLGAGLTALILFD